MQIAKKNYVVFILRAENISFVWHERGLSVCGDSEDLKTNSKHKDKNMFDSHHQKIEIGK